MRGSNMRQEDPWSFAKDQSSDLFEVLMYVYDDGLSFSQWIQRCINDSEYTLREVVRRSCLRYASAYQIISGKRHGSRNKVVQLAIGIGLDIEGTSELLERNGMCRLRQSSRRDATIAYCIARKMSVPQCDDVLMRASMEPLRPVADKE